jgi:hypothetical protein
MFLAWGLLKGTSTLPKLRQVATTFASIGRPDSPSRVSASSSTQVNQPKNRQLRQPQYIQPPQPQNAQRHQPSYTKPLQPQSTPPHPLHRKKERSRGRGKGNYARRSETQRHKHQKLPPNRVRYNEVSFLQHCHNNQYLYHPRAWEKCEPQVFSQTRIAVLASQCMLGSLCRKVKGT